MEAQCAAPLSGFAALCAYLGPLQVHQAAQNGAVRVDFTVSRSAFGWRSRYAVRSRSVKDSLHKYRPRFVVIRLFDPTCAWLPFYSCGFCKGCICLVLAMCNGHVPRMAFTCMACQPRGSRLKSKSQTS